VEGNKAIKRFISFLVITGVVTALLIIRDVPALTSSVKSGDISLIPPTPSYYVPSPANPISISFSRSGRFLAVGGESNQIVIMDLIKKTYNYVKVDAPETSVVISLSFSPDDRYIAAAGDFKGANIRIIDRAERSEAFSFDERTIASHIAFSPDSKYVLSVSYYNLKVWDINNRRLIRILKDDDMPTRAFFVNNGENIITNSGLRLWNWINGEPRARLINSGEQFRGISCQDRSCVFAGMDGLYLFDFASMSMKNLMPGDRGNITGIAYNRKSGAIASVVDDRKLVLMDMTGSITASRGIVGPVRAISFDPDGMVLALCSGGDSVAVFDMKGKEENTIDMSGILREKLNTIKEKISVLAGRIL
jgi:WD40 repeat protein